MNSAEFLSKLKKVKRTGQLRWMACCPAHEDKSPSLSVKEGKDGRILIHCFGGCGIADITRSLGIEIQDLFPERLEFSAAKPYTPGQKPGYLAHELLLVLTEEIEMAALLVVQRTTPNFPWGCDKEERLLLCNARIQAALAKAYPA
ncbi:CHC2 zinc finger domain-containing protein [Ferrovum sp.]|uniref:CHC2 zinc finger domain-containing protein n=1 Tax=Ferrovum sp. TaxID=2609467 RepID=UPI00261F5CDD|nr:CHC2 zinc finger domain-containing protein [Ferrovum sp.]